MKIEDKKKKRSWYIIKKVVLCSSLEEALKNERKSKLIEITEGENEDDGGKGGSNCKGFSGKHED